MANTQRKFGTKGLTHSASHHLLAVDESIGRQGYARVTDIARRLGITRGSVSVAMQCLKSAGYVRQDGNHFFHLTDNGRQAAASLKMRHAVVEEFLTEVLGMSAELSHSESCRVENLINAPTARRLSALVAYWKDNSLSGVLDERLGPECPVCKDQPNDICPCCGLECIDGACPLAETKIA